MGNAPSTQQQVPQIPQVAPAPAITAYIPTPGPRYRHIPRPTFDQLRTAAALWDILVARYCLSYAYVGSFAARLRGEEFPVYDIEIVVEQAAWANNSEVLARILRENPDHVAKTDTNQHIVVTGGDQGVAFVCSALGTNGYPQSFVNPYTLHPAGLEYTFYHMDLGLPDPTCNRTIPVMHPRLLLQQRLYRFAPYAADEKRNVLDFDDIQTFLRCTAVDKTQTFSVDVSHDLFPKVITWIKYAERRGVGTTWGDLNAWRRLGFDLPEEYISRLYRCRYGR
jgi:hypothetical protein